MTKTYKFLSFIVVILLCISCEKDKKTNFTLKGYVKGLKKGTVYLQKLNDTLMVTLDSLEIKGDPNFELSANISEPELFILKLDKNDDQENWVTFFADTGTTKITSTRKLFNFNAKVQGSEQQKVLEEYKTTLSKLNNRNLDRLQENFENNTGKTILEQQLQFTKQKYSYTINFAINHNDSEVAPYLALYEIPNTSTLYLDSIYNSLTDRIKTSKYGKLLKENIALRKTKDSI
ncbi:DUF4369 domain-containing protein [Psychroserpens sp. XS_ASV72]|uniref:DUF4369 domain-containing protein n=1 Tax=Psychroserpens sp. XS_ASV72 TaxID=3241293 RepID=UPI00351156C0